MVVRNKWISIFNAYRESLKDRLKDTKHVSFVKKGNRSKNRILNFYLKNNRWPERTSKNFTEKQLGYRFENYISKKAPAHDPQLREIAMATGRVSNNKRDHNVAQFKKEILEFLKTHGRVPSTSYQFQTVEGEARLRHKLDYYTQDKNDTTLLGKIYDTDKCHLSGIPMKYRRILNEQLELDKPLIRLV